MGQPGHGDAWSRPSEHIGWCEVSGGTETSQYPEEQESTEIPQVVVSERGVCPNRIRAKPGGVADVGLEDLVELAPDSSLVAWV
jgi:hypothetical protein